jgi:hypothetical protein
VRFPLTAELLEEVRRFELRSACVHCFHFVGERCSLEWPFEDQRHWPIDAPLPDGSPPTEIALCKEFELA